MYTFSIIYLDKSLTSRLFLFRGHLKDFIYLFLDKGEGGEKERERNIDEGETH